ncbi:MAG: hypothetical protein ACU84Q_18435 [Gammaproteobacteria bacterium]
MFYAALALILFLLGNGIVMVAFPTEWFYSTPGVAAFGGLNQHFITDIGFIFILCGIAIGWRMLDTVRARSAAIVCAAFLTLHASFHLYAGFFSTHHEPTVLIDGLAIYLPAALALAVATAPSIALRMWFQSLVGRAVHRRISSFEKLWGYDATYMHEIANNDLEAITRFSLLQEFGDYRRDISREGWYTAKLLGCLSEDCGPCAQLIVQMAEADGMDSALISAIIEGKPENLCAATRLYYDHARAVLAHDIEAKNFRAEIFE